MLVYKQGLCNNQTFGFDHSSYYSPSQPQQFYCCEFCGGPRHGSDCHPQYAPYDNQVTSSFDQPPEYQINQSPSRDLELSPNTLEFNRLSKLLQIEIDRLQEDIYSTQMPNRPVDLVEEPEESDDDTKSNVDDFVPIPGESKVTLVSTDLECSMPIDTPLLPCIDVREMKKNLGCFLADGPIPIPKMSNEPLGNSDSMFRSVETSDFLLEELTAKIGLDDSIPMEIDDGY
ncbi:hypothetical protein Tco_1501735 [Tanacetum coccineum]